jgi:ACS family hexuronate transporter-like MFS transporter
MSFTQETSKTQSDGTGEPLRSPIWKWWITGLLLLATTINYMDRVTLSGASVRVTRELGLSELQYGHLELAFGWAFAAGSLVFGFLADRLRVYYLYPAVLLAWSLMGIASGWAKGFEGLLLFRSLLGFFEAGHWPCALKTTFALLDEKDRTMGNSILQSGASIGAVLTPQILKLLMTDAEGSWRSAFVTVGAVGILWVVLWFACLRSRDLSARTGTASQASVRTPENLGTILVSGRFWAVAIVILGAQTVWHIYRVWLMKFLITGRSYEEHTALNFNSLYFIATDVGCLLAGAASVWLIKRQGSSAHLAKRRVYAGACCLTTLCILLPWLEKGVPLMCILLLIGAGALALFPCYYSFVQELSSAHVGQLTGLLSLWVWGVTSPLHSFFGMLVDRTKSYDAGLVVAGLAPWMGVLALRFMWSKSESNAIR